MGQGVRPSDIVEGQLRLGWQSDGGTQIVGLHLRLARDWITYWRHPGESGIAPQLNWSESDNLAQVRIHWPEPRLFLKAGFNSIGYEDELLVPLELTPINQGAPIALRAVLSIGVCDDICIPVDLAFHADIAGAGQHDRRLADILSSRPKTARQVGLQQVECDLNLQKKGAVLEVNMALPTTGQTEFLLIEFPGQNIEGRAMPSHRDGDSLVGQTFLRAKDGRLPAIDRSNIDVTILSENGAITHRGCSIAR
jgi:DsbC/DsbD-like thiol-disulfide interchange protein